MAREAAAKEALVAQALDRIDDASAPIRREQPREPLADATIRWLAGLPDALRPHVLPIRFPHMANALCRHWADQDGCRTYLDELLIDNRGNRRGLPIEVAEELASLKDYFETVLHPVPQTVWDEVAGRKRTR
jgi:hypothetical protein